MGMIQQVTLIDKTDSDRFEISTITSLHTLTVID